MALYKNYMKGKLLYTNIILTTFCGCNKEKNADDATCQNIQNISIVANSPVSIGETIHFGVPEVGGYRIYHWEGPHNYANQYPEDSITDAQLENEGWYYLNLTGVGVNSDCQKIDSVYIDVQLNQGVPPCSMAINTTNFSNMPTDTYSSVNKNIDPSYSQKVLAASGVFSNLTIYFHTHWRAGEPEDGIYNTTNVPIFDQTDNNYNKVFITTTKSSIYWSSVSDQSVYISHVNSKLQVRFCNLSMSGSNGTSYTTTASGNIVEQ
jgi:hypothetical protein